MSDDNQLPLKEDDETFVAWDLGWAFWIQWVLANAVGWSLSPLAQQAVIEASGTSRVQIAMGIAIGTMLGFAQWFIFLPQPYKTGLWWVLVSVAGWGIGWPLGWALGWRVFGGLGFSVVYGVIGAAGGIAAGFGQWLVLRNQIQRAGWWMVVSAVGWSAALALMFTFARGFIWMVTGGLAGALTGGPLIWLLRQPIDESLRVWIQSD